MFCAASVVAAMGVVGLVTNSIIAVTLLGEPLRKRDIFGATLGGAGAFTVGYFAPTTTTVQSSKALLQDVLVLCFGPLGRDCFVC